MPITILDYVKSMVGEKPVYSADDFFSNGVAMTGGCGRCYAALGGYNAYPSKSGYCYCADCIGDTGYATAEEFTVELNACRPRAVTCPSCGTGGIIEIYIITPGTDETSLACGECGQVWEP